MKRALLLNSDYTPLHFISDVSAIILFYKGRAEVVNDDNGIPSTWDEIFNSPSVSIKLPATMRLVSRINKNWKPPRFRKKVLFNRDSWKCQFCSTQLNGKSITIDHVIPKSRGGTTSWHNCVSACKNCNKKKSNMTPEEAGMPLLKNPALPNALHFWDMEKSDCWHDSWNVFLPKFQNY